MDYTEQDADTEQKVADFESADDDIIQPFQLETSSLRGRSVRLGPVLDQILDAHDYPDPVSHLVAETATLALLLSSMLKYEGIFTLQTKGDGPVGMLVADVTTQGDVRACASFDPERLQHAREQLAALKTTESSQNHLAQYLGKGYIAFTVDQGAHTERYQGIVELKGSSLTDCVQHYFNQSEQIRTGIKMAVGKRDKHWRAGGLMLQILPGDDEKVSLGNMDQDDWRRSMILLDTCSEDEILSPELHSNMLLLRLFHEEGVRVFDPISVVKNCRCSAEKVKTILENMDNEEIEYLADEDDAIKMHCEFCSQDYLFPVKDFLKQEPKSSH